MASKIYGIDFGTDTIKFYQKDIGYIFNQRTVLAMKGKNYIAIGDEAYEMYGKSPDYINIEFPIKKGVIASIDKMLALTNCIFMDLSREHGKIKHAQFYVTVPADITDVEKKAFYDIVDKSFIRPKKVSLVDKPIADAYGLGIDIDKSKGALIVDIGGETTEISIISNGGVVISKLVPIGGKNIDEGIITMLRRKYNIIIGDKTAEMLKKRISSLSGNVRNCKVYGRDVVSGLPIEKTISTNDIVPVITEQVNNIIDYIKQLLERTPPEISSDIYKDGIYIVGGTSKIDGIDDFIEDVTRLKVSLTSDPANCAISGLEKIISDPKVINR